MNTTVAQWIPKIGSFLREWGTMSNVVEKLSKMTERYPPDLATWRLLMTLLKTGSDGSQWRSKD